MQLGEEVQAALLRALPSGRVFAAVPEADAALPCISWLENENAPWMRADDGAYTERVQIVVDVWGLTPENIAPIAQAVERELEALGFERLRAVDVPPDGTGARHKNLQYEWIG